MAPVPPTVTWYFSVPEHGDAPGDPDDPKDGPLVIVNLPLIGKLYTGLNDSAGYVTKTPGVAPVKPDSLVGC
jgi:hypothetical protein